MVQQNPIVVDVVRQPPVTAEITMADVVIGAVGLMGVIMMLALLAGVLVGGIFIFLRRRRDAASPPTDPGRAGLRL